MTNWFLVSMSVLMLKIPRVCFCQCLQDIVLREQVLADDLPLGFVLLQLDLEHLLDLLVLVKNLRGQILNE